MSISCIHLVKIIRGIILPEQQRNSATCNILENQIEDEEMWFVLYIIIYNI